MITAVHLVIRRTPVKFQYPVSTILIGAESHFPPTLAPVILQGPQVLVQALQSIRSVISRKQAFHQEIGNPATLKFGGNEQKMNEASRLPQGQETEYLAATFGNEDAFVVGRPIEIVHAHCVSGQP